MKQSFRTRGRGSTRQIYPLTARNSLRDYFKSLKTSATNICELCPGRPEFLSRRRLRKHVVDYHILTPTLTPERIEKLVEYLRRRKVVSGHGDRSLASKMSDIDRFGDVLHILAPDKEEFAVVLRQLQEHRRLESPTLSPEIEERLKGFPVYNLLSEDPEVLRDASERLYSDLTTVMTKEKLAKTKTIVRVRPAETVKVIRVLIERARERGKGELSDEEERERIRKAVAASRAKKKELEKGQ